MCVGKWTEEKLAFGKDPLEIHETLSLPIIGTIITLAQERSICESYVFFIVVGCASAILFNLIAMWPLGLAFMLTSKVCIDDEYETIVFFSLFLLFFFKESMSD